jgi:hypothetical protein
MRALTLVLLLPMLARAQDDPRALFEQGTLALQDGRFVEAVPLLERAHEMAPRVPTAFNLALALAGVGRLTSAIALFDRLIAGEWGELSDDVRTEAGQRREAAARSLAHLSIDLAPADAALRIDNVATVERSLAIDPGHHVLVATARDHRDASEALDLGPGETRSLELRLAVIEPVALADPFWSSAWPWVIGAVLLAGVAASIAIPVALNTTGSPRGDVNETIYTLHIAP